MSKLRPLLILALIGLVILTACYIRGDGDSDIVVETESEETEATNAKTEGEGEQEEEEEQKPDACITRKPVSGVEPQTTEAPYSYTIKVHEDHAQVTLEGADESIKGVMVQGLDQSGRQVGTFDEVNEHSLLFKCDFDNDTLVHYEQFGELKSLTFKYNFPEGSDGSGIHIIATVVKNYITYWLDVKSEDFDVLRKNQEPKSEL